MRSKKYKKKQKQKISQILKKIFLQYERKIKQVY